MVELSEQQQQALDRSSGHPLCLTDPRTSAAYILIPADQYESVREALDDDRVQRAVRSVASQNAAARGEEEP